MAGSLPQQSRILIWPQSLTSRSAPWRLRLMPTPTTSSSPNARCKISASRTRPTVASARCPIKSCSTASGGSRAKPNSSPTRSSPPKARRHRSSTVNCAGSFGRRPTTRCAACSRATSAARRWASLGADARRKQNAIICTISTMGRYAIPSPGAGARVPAGFAGNLLSGDIRSAWMARRSTSFHRSKPGTSGGHARWPDPTASDGRRRGTLHGMTAKISKLSDRFIKAEA